MADVRVGGIFADFYAKNAGFVRATRQNAEALRRQQRAANEFKSSLTRLNSTARTTVKRLTLLRSTVAFLAGAGGLARLVTQQAKFGAQLVETSKRTGVAIRDLQQLQRVFEGDGASAEQTTEALETLNRRISEARGGLATYVRAFEDLGVAVEDLPTGASVDFLAEIADRFQALTSHADRARVAQDLFGRSGQVLLPVLQRGGADLRRQAQSFERLGLVLDEEALALKAMDQAFTDVGNTLRVNLARAVAQTNGELVVMTRFIGEQIPKAFSILIQVTSALVRHIDAVIHVAGLLIGVLALRRMIRIAKGVFAVTAQYVTLRGVIYAVLRAARFLVRTIGLFAVVEGLIQLGKFFINLRSEIISLSTTFKDVALVAGLNFIEALIEAFVGLPGLLTTIFRKALLFAIRNILPEDFSQKVINFLELDKPDLFEKWSADFKKTFDLMSMLDEDTKKRLEEADKALKSAAGNTLNDLLEAFKSDPTPLPEEPPLLTEPPLNLDGRDGGSTDVLAVQTKLVEELRDETERRNIALRHSAQLIGLEGRELARVKAGHEVLARFTEQRYQIESKLAQAQLLRWQTSHRIIKIKREDVNFLSPTEYPTAEERQALIKSLKNQRDEADKTINSYQAQLEELEAQRDTIETIAEQRREQAGLEFDIQLQMEKAQEPMRRAREAAQAVGRSFEDLAVSAITNFHNIGDAARGLARTLVSSLLRTLILSPITNAVTGAVAGWLQPSAPIPAQGGTFPIFPRQRGGFTPPGLVLAGEAGPELIDFQQPGRVYTNETLRDIMRNEGQINRQGAPVINVSVNAEAGVSSDEVRTMIGQAAPAIVDAARGSVGADLGRPSALRRTAGRR